MVRRIKDFRKGGKNAKGGSSCWIQCSLAQALRALKKEKESIIWMLGNLFVRCFIIHLFCSTSYCIGNGNVDIGITLILFAIHWPLL